ncbi:hypothetical protein GGH92_001657 [Coemansia sp. RSA 2673]|nr:hypothetical protein GGH92_001657 [Coemansia sp. RSA 2673]
MAAPSKTGRVKFFNSQKGYGFVVPDEPIDGNAEVFVHHTVIHNSGGFKSLAEGEYVEFDVMRGPKGLQATRVTGPNGTFVRGDPFTRFRAKPLLISTVSDGVSSSTVTSPYFAYSPYPPGYSQILPYGTQLGQQQPPPPPPQFSAFAYPTTQQQQQQQQQQQPSGGFVVQPGQVGDTRAVVGVPQLGLPAQFFSPSHLSHHHHRHQQPQPQQHQQPPQPQQLQLQQPSLDAMATSYDTYFRQQQGAFLQAYDIPATYVMPGASANMANNGGASQLKHLQQPQPIPMPPPHSSSPTLAFTAAPSRQGSKSSLLSVTAPFTGFPE